jgi:hypothetical protein
MLAFLPLQAETNRTATAIAACAGFGTTENRHAIRRKNKTQVHSEPGSHFLMRSQREGGLALRRAGDGRIGCRRGLRAGDIGQQGPYTVRLHRHVGIVQKPIEFIKLSAVFRSRHSHLSSHGRPRRSAMRAWRNRGLIVNMSCNLAFRIAPAITVTTGSRAPGRGSRRRDGRDGESAIRRRTPRPVRRRQTSRSARRS